MKTLPRLLAVVLLFTAPAFAEEPPPLGRTEARRILEHMEWRGINILAIRQGVNDKGTVAPIYATVLAFATRDSRDQSVCQTFTFDRDIGWHLLEVSEKEARLWNKDGYSEIKPWGTWIRTIPK
ncbi:MAG: hypothetical protein ABMA01_13070 [Chthoniobacteraceae bacterium]